MANPKYQLDSTPVYFEVKDGKCAPVVLTNKMICGILIHKTSSTTGDGIYGVPFILYDSNHNPIAQEESDNEGYVRFEGLSAGRYFLREGDNEGYIPDKQEKTVYVKDGETTIIEWKNTPITGQIQITKYADGVNTITGQTSGVTLKGATYEITWERSGNLDRGLPPEERQEWNSIYASYRGRSAITGTIIGVDPHSIYVWNPETERREKKTMYCAIVVPYRVRIVIPASEMWESGNERPDYVLQNMVGASIDLVIIKVEREAGFAIGSRRLASRSQRYFFAHREDLHRIGSRVKCRMLAVGPRRCLVDCYGHDLDLTQREMRYAAIPDLRDEYHPGMELESVVKVYDSTKDELIISVKETETNPILGAEQRHPVGSRRLAVISGKYGGGVFCNLPDGVVCMCNYSFQHEDSDFMVGENVMLVVQRYNEEKLQMFGKILSKW